MGLGDRIESRRIALGITQAELARRAGMRQSTMNSLVKGNSRTTRYLVQLARELHTTPAYLTGETDDPQSNQPELNFTSSEREIIDLVRALVPEDRLAFHRILRAMAASDSRATLHDKPQEFRGE